MACSLFGARPIGWENGYRCRCCKKAQPEVYDECTTKSKDFWETSVVTDGDKKIIIKEKPDSEIGNAKMKVKEKKNMTTDETKQDPEPNTKRVETKGVLQVAKQMLSDGKSSSEILQVLIEMYLQAGKDSKQAKRNAQSAIFNARKKMGLGIEPPTKPTDVKNEGKE